MDLMVKTTMTIEREVDDMRSIRDVCVKDKKRESQPSSSNSWKKQKTSTSKGFKDRAVATKAKPRVNHPKMGGNSRLLASQSRGHVSIATSLDIGNKIILRGKDPKVMRHPSPSH